MTMPAPSRRPAPVDLDDPWGFGASDGVLVELRRDPPADPPVAPRPARPAAPAMASVAALDLGELRPYLAAQNDPPATSSAAFVPDPFTQRAQPRRLVTALLALALVGTSGVGAYVWFAADRDWSTSRAVVPGTFVLSSQPPGAQVTVDGALAGVTPLALQLTPGPHEVVATAPNGVSERVRADVTPGQSAARHLTLEPPSLPAAAAAALPPGDPASAVAAPVSAVPGPVPPAPGFVSFALPFDVQVYENGAFLGSNSGERLRVRPGRHTFTLVNEPLGFRADETVVVGAGRSLRRVIEQPSAPLSVNALPWAEMFISGRSFGETPLANISLPIGSYRVTLRHPTLGDREVPVTVRLGAPNRVAVDLRR